MGMGRGISFLKTVNTLLSESTEGRRRHKGGHAFARTVGVGVGVWVGIVGRHCTGPSAGYRCGAAEERGADGHVRQDAGEDVDGDG